MLNPLALMKSLQSGEMGIDEIEETLSLLGIEARIAPLEEGEGQAEFVLMTQTAPLPSSPVMKLDLRTKKGLRLSGLLVVHQA